MKVTMLTHTPLPEKIISAAARLCYSDSSIDDLIQMDDAQSEKMLNLLNDVGHESPIEHVYFTFGIEGVSRTLLAQITRHRIASFSVQSQRYIRNNHFAFVIPPEIKKDKNILCMYKQSIENSVNTYNQIADILQEKYYTEFLISGYLTDKAKVAAEKKAIEDARFVLPNATETKIILSMNARSLMNFFQLRCCNRAQWEIRAVANDMLKLCKSVAPHLFKHAGPTCVSGQCNEGRMTCGHAKQIREMYLSSNNL